jgi:hypothetical protein
MSLSTWEQQALDSIKDGLAGSDPELTALLTTFTLLAADEEMPAGSRCGPGHDEPSRARARSGAGPARRTSACACGTPCWCGS